MGTDRARHQALLSALDATDWSRLLPAVASAEAWSRTAVIGDPMLDEVAEKLAGLAHHPKWEVRRAVANTAAQVGHSAFERALARLLLDDNERVRQAAQQATLRRRDSRNASTLGKQHAQRVNATLDDIEARFGLLGREAVRRAAEQIADTFARELYHEVIRLLSPLAMSAERLREQLSSAGPAWETMREETVRIERRVEHLRAVLQAMRAYTDQPALTFSDESLRDVVIEAADLIRRRSSAESDPAIEVVVPADLVVEIAKPRFVQALTNMLENAVDAYDGLESRRPITVRAERLEGLVALVIEDHGCGMSSEVKADAVKLFATSKSGGTGFGLPLAVKIVESEHEGRVDLDSEPRRGTVVRLTFRTHR
jgi:nitrogen fixation/metabolism regulation signal transduction histidine kinase